MTSARKRKIKENLVGYAFLLPFLIVFIVFIGYPVIYSFILALHRTTIFSNWYDIFSDMKFVGLMNFKDLIFHDFAFWWSVVLTLYYALLCIPGSLAISLSLALILNNKFRGKSFFRSAFFLPNVLDLLVIGIIWVLIYSPQYGLLDSILSKLGIHYFSQNGFLGNPKTALPSIAFAIILKGAGFGMILFLTTLQNIPTSIFEAADIDGATPFQKLKNITLPLLKPIILFMVVTGTMAALNAFTEIYAMSGGSGSPGGPAIKIAGHAVGATKLSGYYLFQRFERGNYGYAAAISYMLLLIALTISLISKKVLYSED